MKRIFLISAVLVLSPIIAFGQTKPAPVKPAEKVLDPSAAYKANYPFEGAGDFSDGVAAAAAKVTTPATATEEEKTEPLWGYIDGNGHWVIKPRFARARAFHEGIAPAAILEKGGRKEVMDPYQGKMFVETDDNVWWGLVDKTGKWAAPAKFEELGEYGEGMAPCKVKQLWGYIDKTGTMVVKDQFMIANGFHEGLAAVKIEIPRLRFADRFWGYINKSGAFAIAARFDEAGDFNGGKAVAKDGGATVTIDKNGTASGALAADVETGKTYPAPTQGKDGKWGYADAKGKFVIHEQFDEARAMANGFACVGLRDADGRMHYGFVKKDGGFLHIVP